MQFCIQIFTRRFNVFASSGANKRSEISPVSKAHFICARLPSLQIAIMENVLDRYEEVYHHVVGDPLKAMPSTLKKKKVPAGAKA